MVDKKMEMIMSGARSPLRGLDSPVKMYYRTVNTANVRLDYGYPSEDISLPLVH